jgi:hypothetical protein
MFFICLKKTFLFVYHTIKLVIEKIINHLKQNQNDHCKKNQFFYRYIIYDPYY